MNEHTAEKDEPCCAHPKCPGGSLCCCQSAEKDALAPIRAVLDEEFFIPSQYEDDGLIYADHLRAALADAEELARTEGVASLHPLRRFLRRVFAEQCWHSWRRGAWSGDGRCEPCRYRVTSPARTADV